MKSYFSACFIFCILLSSFAAAQSSAADKSVAADKSSAVDQSFAAAKSAAAAKSVAVDQSFATAQAFQGENRDPFLPGNFFSVKDEHVSLVRAPVDPILTDDVPTLDQVRLIPSLKGEQNKKVSELFELYRSEIKPLQTQLKEARTALAEERKRIDRERQAREKLAKERQKAEKQTKEQSKLTQTKDQPGGQPKETQTKEQQPKEQPTQAVNEQEQKALDDQKIAALLKNESDTGELIKKRRLQLMTDLKQIITDEQLGELQRIKRGEIIEVKD